MPSSEDRALLVTSELIVEPGYTSGRCPCALTLDLFHKDDWGRIPHPVNDDIVGLRAFARGARPGGANAGDYVELSQYGANSRLFATGGQLQLMRAPYTAVPTANAIVTATGAAKVPLVVESADGQSAHLLEFRDSGGNILSYFDIDGTFSGDVHPILSDDEPLWFGNDNDYGFMYDVATWGTQALTFVAGPGGSKTGLFAMGNSVISAYEAVVGANGPSVYVRLSDGPDRAAGGYAAGTVNVTAGAGGDASAGAGGAGGGYSFVAGPGGAGTAAGGSGGGFEFVVGAAGAGGTGVEGQFLVRGTIVFSDIAGTSTGVIRSVGALGATPFLSIVDSAGTVNIARFYDSQDTASRRPYVLFGNGLATDAWVAQGRVVDINAKFTGPSSDVPMGLSVETELAYVVADSTPMAGVFNINYTDATTPNANNVSITALNSHLYLSSAVNFSHASPYFHGGQFSSTTNAAVTVAGTVAGSASFVNPKTAGASIATAIGARGYISQSDGATTNAIGVSGHISLSGGTITSACALRGYLSSGTPTNYTDLVLGQSTIPTGNYGIYSAGTSGSYFAGSILHADQKGAIFGTDSDWSLYYDETTTDALVLSEVAVGALAIKGATLAGGFVAAADTVGNNLFAALQSGGTATAAGKKAADFTFEGGAGSVGVGATTSGAGSVITITNGAGGPSIDNAGSTGGAGGITRVICGAGGAKVGAGTAGAQGYFAVRGSSGTDELRFSMSGGYGTVNVVATTPVYYVQINGSSRLLIDATNTTHYTNQIQSTTNTVNLGSPTAAWKAIYGGESTAFVNTTGLYLGASQQWRLWTNSAQNASEATCPANSLVLNEGTVPALCILGSAISGFTAAADTAGNDIYQATQTAGAGATVGKNGAMSYWNFGAGSNAASGSNAYAGGVGGGSTLTFGAGGNGDTTGTGGNAGGVTFTGAAGGTGAVGGIGTSYAWTAGTGGNGTTTGGAGGGITFTTGNAGTGGNAAGGNFTVNLGTNTGSGATGCFYVTGQAKAGTIAQFSSGSINGSTYYNFLNPNNGTATAVYMNLGTSSSVGLQMLWLPSAYTTNGIYVGGRALWTSSGDNGIVIDALNASAPIVFLTDGANYSKERARIDATYGLRVACNGTTTVANCAYLNMQSVTEELTCATGATTFTSTTAALPANAYIVGVTMVVTQACTDAITWKAGIAGADDVTGLQKFAEALQPKTLGQKTSSWGAGHAAGTGGPPTMLTPYTNAAAAGVVVTTSGDPGATALKVRITTFYFTFTAPAG